MEEPQSGLGIVPSRRKPRKERPLPPLVVRFVPISQEESAAKLEDLRQLLLTAWLRDRAEQQARAGS